MADRDTTTVTVVIQSATSSVRLYSAHYIVAATLLAFIGLAIKVCLSFADSGCVPLKNSGE